MKGICYYCNKELTERTIKRHMKNCPEMKKVIENGMENSKGKRNQFIISIKYKYDTDYCIYISIDEALQLQHLDQFIRDVWVECCGHLSMFTIDGEMYNSYDEFNSDDEFNRDEMNTALKDVLSVNKKFEYQYDFGSTTYIILEVIDLIKVPKKFSRLEIIARNNEMKYKCDLCGKEAKYNCWSKGKYMCEACSKGEDELEELVYCNSPRDGVCGYEGNKDAEKEYLPSNNKKNI